MNGYKRSSVILTAMVLCLSMALFAGCQYSSTHESETNVEISTGDDSDTADDSAIRDVASSIDEFLNDDWPDSHYVSYTGDDGSEDANTIFVLFWKNGIQSIDNADDLITVMKEDNEGFQKALTDAGITDGHVDLQILVGVDDDDYTTGSCVIEVVDGEVTYNAYAE